MLRPKRSESRRNVTSMDSQYEKEQRRLEARRAAYAARNAGILGRIQRDPEQIARERVAAAEEMAAHMARAKEAAEQLSQKELSETFMESERITREVESDDERAKQRKEWSHKMMMQNRELCEYRYAQRQQLAAAEKQVDKETLKNGFMNRFGTSLQ